MIPVPLEYCQPKVNRSVSSFRKAESDGAGERILRAATKLFYARGINAVGVDAIALEAGVSKRTLYKHYASKETLVAAYLTAQFRHIAPSDAPAREQILGQFERLERSFARPDFRGCPYVNAVSEIGDPKHGAHAIAAQFKEQRRQWFRALAERLGVADADDLATQLMILHEGAFATALVRGDPKVARSARAAAETLLAAAVVRRRQSL